MVTGNFSCLDISGLLRHLGPKQIVKVPTRKDTTLDLILMNMHEYFNLSQAFLPFGLSDHNAIVASLLQGQNNINTKKTITKQDLQASFKAMGKYLNLIDWSLLFTPLEGCEEMWDTFSEVVHTGLDILMSEKQYRICSADASWMTQSESPYTKETKGLFYVRARVHSIQVF